VRRIRLHRSAGAYWTSALALALVTGVFVAGVVRGAEDRAARYGSVRRVLVARRALRAGAAVRAGDVSVRIMPAAFVPVGILAAQPIGRSLLVPMAAGEVFLRSKLAPDGLSGVAALLRTGERALALPVGPGTPPLSVGDRVDVLATPPDGATVVVALAARVLGVDDRAVTVAVHPDDTPHIATALAAGTVTLALSAEWVQ
jgi:Flp pilus assembly protein CpaB